MSTEIMIMLAVNDPDNGVRTSRCRSIAIADALHLEMDYENRSMNCVIDLKAKTVKLCRRTYPILRHHSWVGNWCWDAVWVAPDVAAQITNYIRTLKLMALTTGNDPHWEKYRDGAEFVAADFTDNEAELAKIENDRLRRAGQLELWGAQS